MRGGPRLFPQGFPCPVVLRITPGMLAFRLRGFHPLRPAFPVPFCFPCMLLCVSLPRSINTAVWAFSAFARRYLRSHFCFLFLRLLRCFSSPGSLRIPTLLAYLRYAVHVSSTCGSPHSDTRGSLPMCGSPRLFAAYRVFLRLPVPGHPPCALSCLTFF